MFDLSNVNILSYVVRTYLLNVHVSIRRKEGGGGTKFPEATVFNEVMTTI